MAPKKILFLYIHPGTGHESAAKALQEAVHNINPRVYTESIDSLRYTYPILSTVLSKTYSGIIKRTPQLWDYLYDNPDIVQATAKLRNMLGKLKLRKIEKLLEYYNPDVVVCTQAAPCLLISAYKEQTGWRRPLVAVVTDYRAHAYWYAPFTDLFVVPTGQTKQDLVQLGIQERKIKVLGIPIDPKFAINQDKTSAKQRMKLNPWLPTILVMGGSQGLGPMDAVINQLAEVRMPIQSIVICGTNRKLRRKIKHKTFHFGSTIRIMGYTKNIDKIMNACDLIITKPGGMTSSEALAKNLPMIIIKPIPGQEEKNSQFLCRHNVAIRLDDISNLQQIIEYLIRHPEKLEIMQENAGKIAKPNASLMAANAILELLDQ